jgi:hypothetical protein
MATKPGVLSEWPWQRMGNYKVTALVRLLIPLLQIHHEKSLAMCDIFTNHFLPSASSTVSIWTLPGISAEKICGPDLVESIVEIPIVENCSLLAQAYSAVWQLTSASWSIFP